MMTDPIADFLTRLRNASHARRREVMVRASRMSRAIAGVLAQKHFVESVSESDNELKIVFRTDREPLELKRMSKPGQRLYIGSSDIKRVRNGLGIAIISTSRGVLPGEDAKKEKLGGEYICEVY